jgi:hypothetical protein
MAKLLQQNLLSGHRRADLEGTFVLFLEERQCMLQPSKYIVNVD